MTTGELSNRMCTGPCGGRNERRARQRWCLDCHAAWMRANRPRHVLLSEQARLKANCRRRTRYLIVTGQLIPKPCRLHKGRGCEGAIVPHHLDYTNPRDVEWLCELAHRVEHAKLRREPELPFAGPLSIGAVAC